ncbi:polyamine aminopropyltransferase [Rhodococcus tibetensis]|uniref:Polyamine aminopropyltransferase n=1 Tax=Rhodococcus tibetensis TaxID=2965064 RepID=A0ABT1QIU7_9NOCA|nr:polyamine aminopropyltransferase [Rhodococcus sp. FXJ9.536]MCQ4122206.1 polyamine aminopropyltransferase [Rhodococcus sp. FXJ9.536]
MTAVAAESGTKRALDGRSRVLLLAAVAACAACGLIYELALLTLSISLTGGGITQTSLIVAGFVAALGVGALAAKPLLSHAAVSFVAVEIVLGLAGGFSAVTLYVTFTFFGSSAVVLVLATALIGVLVGAEVPLLMTLLQSGRNDNDAETTGKVLANLNAADYAGALVGGLLWPFVLLPVAGMIRGAAITGIINLVAAAVVALILLRWQLSVRTRLLAVVALLLAAACIAVLLVRADGIETTSRQRLYTDPVVAAERSQYQEIVVTERGNDVRLFLDGDLQFSSADEHRYTESLVYPAMARNPERVLILGGGDGLAAREVLRLNGVREIVQVELDPAVVELASTRLADLNKGALQDPRVHVVIDDAFRWLRDPPGNGFDAVIVDLPDPDTPALGRLYSTEFYGLVAGALEPGGLMVVQAGSPYSTPDAFWRTTSTVASAGLSVTPYHVLVPSFGDWGFVLASPDPEAPSLHLPSDVPDLRFLDEPTLAASAVFSRDRPPRVLEPSTLDRPRIVDDMRKGYER